MTIKRASVLLLHEARAVIGNVPKVWLYGPRGKNRFPQSCVGAVTYKRPVTIIAVAPNVGIALTVRVPGFHTHVPDPHKVVCREARPIDMVKATLELPIFKTIFNDQPSPLVRLTKDSLTRLNSQFVINKASQETSSFFYIVLTVDTGHP
ncbi:hypothetical protein BYT27DRAFT_7252591 [Phlegmacium glaucopus]|nr:hypothetical protein BYT27DRAFT_7252591 [Phlegmacium glaucopus]